MRSVMASSGCGRCLKPTHSVVGTGTCVSSRVRLSSLGISPLEFPWFSRLLIHTQGHCWHPSASPGAHLRQSPYRSEPGWFFFNHMGLLFPPLLSDYVATFSSQACVRRVLASETDAHRLQGTLDKALSGLLEAPPNRLESPNICSTSSHSANVASQNKNYVSQFSLQLVMPTGLNSDQ